jgi:hypothetical protein
VLGRWAARSPKHDPSLPLSAVSLLLSFRTMLDPERAKGIDARIGFRIGQESFLTRLAEGQIHVERGALEEADLIFTGAAPSIAATVYGGQPLSALVEMGMLSIEGDEALANRFTTLFPLPAKAGP